MNRFASCSALLAAALASCTGQPSPSAQRQPIIPVVTATATETVTVQPSPATSVLAVKLSKTPQAVPAARSAVAEYAVDLSCVSAGKRRSGAAVKGAPESRSARAVAGNHLSYSFVWESDSSSKDPIVKWTKTCTIRARQTRAGTQPNVRAALSCTGEATFQGGTPTGPTSAVAESWRSMAELENPYTHTMLAPKSSGQLSERDDCTLALSR